jgi:hypothetical protein
VRRFEGLVSWTTGGGSVTDDCVIDIRQYLGKGLDIPFPRAFSIWGGKGAHSRFALPVWRAVSLLGGDWGGIVSQTKLDKGTAPSPLFLLDLKEEPARTECPLEPIPTLEFEKAPALAAVRDGGLAVLLGESAERRWFLRVTGGRSETLPQGKARESLLFLAGECSGLLFLRELATPLPSSSSAP